MILLSVRITTQQKEALLSFYPEGIKHFVEKTISNTADRIITEKSQFDIEEELKAYHDRRVLNDYNFKKKKMTQGTKDKISKALKATSERQGWKGMKLLEETKQRLRGRIVTKETRDSISRGNKGKKRSEEQRQNISSGKTGTKYTKEHKQNMSLARVGKKHKRELIN